MKKIIFLLIIIYTCIAQVNAQSGCYERLYDPSGLNTDSYQASNPAAESFPVVMPEMMGLVSADIFDASIRLIKCFEERSLMEVPCGEWSGGNYTVRIMSLELPKLEIVSVNVVANEKK